MDKWFNEAKLEIKNLHLLEGCEFILRLEDFHLDEDNNCIYLVTELGEKNLLDHIAQNPPTEPEIKKIIFSVLTGLAFAHQRKVVHRDIKPENVLLGKSGSFLLCDWGISQRMKKMGTQTHGFKAKGTPLYTPPEIFKFVEGMTDQVNLF